MKVFFGQPIDFRDKLCVQKQLRQFHHRIQRLPIEVVAPYQNELERDLYRQPMTKREADQIVAKDLNALEASDILVADVSQENRQAIGMLFEIAHARSMNKYIIVHTGQSSISSRVWIRAYADSVCRSWDEVFEKLRERIESIYTKTNGKGTLVSQNEPAVASAV